MEVLQREMKLATKGNKIKEIKVLKKVVQNLEVMNTVVSSLPLKTCTCILSLLEEHVKFG